MEQIILDAWEQRENLTIAQQQQVLNTIETVFDHMEAGKLAAVRWTNDQWQANIWVKKAILLYFRMTKPVFGEHGPARWYDKIPLQWHNWQTAEFEQRQFRAVPGAIVRRSAYIAPGVVLMPCFINMGASVGQNTMIDTWATVGSCAHIGRNCHISGGTGIGGVLEPLQASPVIIEDDCFIGARSEIAEGVVVEKGCVISMGVFIGASTKIVDRQTGHISYGRVPAYSVVVPGVMPSADKTGPALAAAIIIKTVDAKVRAKVSLNELLRQNTD